MTANLSRCSLVCLFSVLLALPPGAGAQTAGSLPVDVKWSAYFGAADDDDIRGLAPAPGGGLFFGGDTGGSSLPAGRNQRQGGRRGGWRGYVARMDADGRLLWSVILDGPNNVHLQELAADGRGNVYAAGMAYGDPGGEEWDSEGHFVAKVNGGTGAIEWFRPVGVKGFTQGYDGGLAVDAAGNLYFTATANGDVEGARNKRENWDAFVAKFAPDGARQWFVFVGGSKDDHGNDIHVLPDGRILLAGHSEGSGLKTGDAYDLPKCLNTWRGGKEDGFVAMLDPSGNVLWSRLLGGSGDDKCRLARPVSDGIVVLCRTDSKDPEGPVKGAFSEGGLIARLGEQGALLGEADSKMADSDSGFGNGFVVRGADIVAPLTDRAAGLAQITVDGETVWHADAMRLLGFGGGTSWFQPVGAQRYYLADRVRDDKMLTGALNRPVGRADAYVMLVEEKGATEKAAEAPVFQSSLSDGAEFKAGADVPVTWSVTAPGDVREFTTYLDGQSVSSGGATPGRPTAASGRDVLTPKAGAHEWKVVVTTADGNKHEKTAAFNVAGEDAGAVPRTIPTDTPTTPATPPPPTRPTLYTEDHVVLAEQTAVVPVMGAELPSVASLNFVLRYDPKVVKVADVKKGALLEDWGASFRQNPQAPGIIRFGFAGTRGVSGQGPVAQIHFKAVGKPGDRTTLTLEELRPTDAAGETLSLASGAGSVTIARKEDIQKGDGNSDGKVDILDAYDALSMSVELIPVNLAADMDGDGKVTAEDAMRILLMAIQ